MSKGARIAVVAGILAVIAILALTLVSYQRAPQSNDTTNSNPITNQSDNTTGKKVTIDLNENLGLKEKP